MNRWALRFACLLCFALAAAPVMARPESSVMVLGVRSLDGDDALARQVSLALRNGARTVSGWRVSDRDVSLAQMSLVHGCEEPDARCMADIASTLGVERLIYATMVRSGDRVQLALFNFNAVTGRVQSSFERSVQAAELVEPALEATMTALVKRLAGEKVAGMLRIVGDIPNAEVTLDGKPAGTLDVRGELLITEVPAGRHILRVEAPDGRKEQTIEIAEGTTKKLRVALRSTPQQEAPQPVQRQDEEVTTEDPPEAPRSVRRTIGWSAVALSGAFLAATVYSWIRIASVNNDRHLNAYRDEFPTPANNGPSDVCREADRRTLARENPNDAAAANLEAKARDLCGEADTFEMLQYVFLGSALAVGGVGAYLLLSSPKNGSKTVSFEPRFGPGRATLSARLRF